MNRTICIFPCGVGEVGWGAAVVSTLLTGRYSGNKLSAKGKLNHFADLTVPVLAFGSLSFKVMDVLELFITVWCCLVNRAISRQ